MMMNESIFLLTGRGFWFPRDAVVDALMPASMIIPAERPSSSPVPPAESSSSSSVSDEEGPPIPPEAEEQVNHSLWQDKKGEVRNALSVCTLTKTKIQHLKIDHSY